MKPEVITLNINGRVHSVALDPNVTLLTALRDLGYTLEELVPVCSATVPCPFG